MSINKYIVLFVLVLLFLQFYKEIPYDTYIVFALVITFFFVVNDLLMICDHPIPFGFLFENNSNNEIIKHKKVKKSKHKPAQIPVVHQSAIKHEQSLNNYDVEIDAPLDEYKYDDYNYDDNNYDEY